MIKGLKYRVSRRYLEFIEAHPRWSSFLGFTKQRRRPLIALFVVVMHVLGFYYSIHAVMQTRSPRGAVAWAVSLNTLPYLAVPAYWVFGGNSFDEYVETRVKRLEMTRPIAEELIEGIRDIESQNPDQTEIKSAQISRTLETITGFPAVSGNHAELLINGQAALDAICSSIESATDYVLVEFYIIRDDETGGRLKDALLGAAGRGVRVYVLYDDYGSLDLDDDFLKDLVDAGVKVSSFMNFKGKVNRLKLNYRDHRKIVIVDGEKAFVGGVNIGDEYVDKHPKYTPWRDTHLRLRGPIVSCIQVPFVEDWRWAQDEAIEGLNWDIKKRYDEKAGELKMSCVPSGPGDDMKTCSLFFQTLINSASERVWISTPYFVPDESIIHALQLADARGVEVKILIPSMLDSVLVSLSSQSFLRDFKGTNVELRQYQAGFLHQKAILIDDNYAALGSANLDNRSLSLNFEVMIGIAGEQFAAKVEEMLSKDFEESEVMKFEDFRRKSHWHRFKVRVARLLAPIQ